MLNVLIAGIGGQGSVLAAKILAQAAQNRGWQVRTAETIGMAQRGGNVTSHIRMGSNGEAIHSSLVAHGQADLVIALEPGEGVRALPYLASNGLMVCASTPIPSVATSLAGDAYQAGELLSHLRSHAAHFVQVDEAAICDAVGSRKVANVVMLAAAVISSRSCQAGLGDAIDLDELTRALEMCVKERFIALNCSAIELTNQALSGVE